MSYMTCVHSGDRRAEPSRSSSSVGLGLSDLDGSAAAVVVGRHSALTMYAINRSIVKNETGKTINNRYGNAAQICINGPIRNVSAKKRAPQAICPILSLNSRENPLWAVGKSWRLRNGRASGLCGLIGLEISLPQSSLVSSNTKPHSPTDAQPGPSIGIPA